MKPNKYRGVIDKVFGYVMNNKRATRQEIRANFAVDYTATNIKGAIDHLLLRGVFEENDGIIRLNSEIVK